MAYHLAQLNIARMRAPLTDPVMAGFVNQLERINAVAEQSPGFVWRLQTPDGDATAIQAFDDPTLLINMSVWESVDALKNYVYKSDHIGPLRDRKAWFAELDGPHLVLWWIPAGHIPTVEEARSKLEYLQQNKPSPEAFTFKNPFPPPRT